MLAAAVVVLVYGGYLTTTHAHRRVSRSRPAARRHPDRMPRPVVRGSRDARHAAHRDGHPRGVRRRGGAQPVEPGDERHLRRVRVGNRNPLRPANRHGANGHRADAAGHSSADDAAGVDHGADHARRDCTAARGRRAANWRRWANRAARRTDGQRRHKERRRLESRERNRLETWERVAVENLTWSGDDKNPAGRSFTTAGPTRSRSARPSKSGWTCGPSPTGWSGRGS